MGEGGRGIMWLDQGKEDPAADRGVSGSSGETSEDISLDPNRNFWER